MRLTTTIAETGGKIHTQFPSPAARLLKPCAATRRVSVPTVIVSSVIRIAMVEPPLLGGPAKQDQTKDQRTQISCLPFAVWTTASTDQLQPSFAP